MEYRIENKVKCPKCKWDHRCCVVDCDLCGGIGRVSESVAREYELGLYANFKSGATNALGNFKCEWLADGGRDEKV